MYEGTCVNLNTLILNTLIYELCKENFEWSASKLCLSLPQRIVEQ